MERVGDGSLPVVVVNLDSVELLKVREVVKQQVNECAAHGAFDVFRRSVLPGFYRKYPVFDW